MNIYDYELSDLLKGTSDKIKSLLIEEISKIVDSRCVEILKFKKNTHLTDDIIIKELYYNKDNGLVFAYENLKKGESDDMYVSDLSLNLIFKITKLMVSDTEPYYKYLFKCESEPYEECFEVFNTADDAYEYMKKAACERLSSLTEKSEMEDVPNGTCMHFNLDFYHDKIVLEGHGGECIYKVIKIG